MPSFRRAIPDFQLANPLYVGAQVFVHRIDNNGQATGQLATLYAGPRGTQTISNPIILDGEGKFARIPYIEGAVSMSVISATVGTHQTGIVLPLGTWRGTWEAGTTYVTNDFVAWGDPDYPVIYGAANLFVARDTIEDDIAAGDLVKIIDAALLDALRDAVVEARNEVMLIKGNIEEMALQVEGQYEQSQASFAEYRNAYYGPYPAHPTTRPDGSPIQVGDSYLRTTEPQGLHYYLDGVWVAPSSDAVELAKKLDKSHEGAGGTDRHPIVTAPAGEVPGVAGFMSPEDKAKLDGIEDGATNYVHPTGDGYRHVPATTAANVNKVLKSAGAAGQPPAWVTLSKADVGLSLVDNTRDVDKPISLAVQEALKAKAPLSSPAFTGTPTVPTPSASADSAQIPNTAWVQDRLAAKANLASPNFTGAPTAPNPSSGANSTQIATTAWVQARLGGYAVVNHTHSQYALVTAAVTGVRLGSFSDVGVINGQWWAADGHFIFGVTEINGSISRVVQKPIQRLINGSWATVSG